MRYVRDRFEDGTGGFVEVAEHGGGPSGATPRCKKLQITLDAIEYQRSVMNEQRLRERLLLLQVRKLERKR